MCGRYSFTQAPDPAMVVQPEHLEVNLGPRYNLAPSQYAPVIPQGDAGRIHLFRWGLVPHWAKDIKIGYKLINARSETAWHKPAFRDAIRQRRCLVLADGFYEWKKTKGGKQPYRIVLKEQEQFSFAGISARWRAPEGHWLETFSILTTEPNELMADIHDRMPVILSAVGAEQWLAEHIDEETLVELARPFASEKMKAYPVSPRVGNVRNDDPELIEPYVPPRDLFS